MGLETIISWACGKWQKEYGLLRRLSHVNDQWAARLVPPSFPHPSNTGTGTHDASASERSHPLPLVSSPTRHSSHRGADRRAQAGWARSFRVRLQSPLTSGETRKPRNDCGGKPISDCTPPGSCETAKLLMLLRRLLTRILFSSSLQRIGNFQFQHLSWGVAAVVWAVEVGGRRHQFCPFAIARLQSMFKRRTLRCQYD